MAARNCKSTVDLDAVDTHFTGLRGDIDVAQKTIIAAQAVVEMVDALQKEGALVEGVDYFGMLRAVLKDAGGMITAAGVEWEETELAMGGAK
jgi:hypothetical protein